MIFGVAVIWRVKNDWSWRRQVTRASDDGQGENLPNVRAREVAS